MRWPLRRWRVGEALTVALVTLSLSIVVIAVVFAGYLNERNARRAETDRLACAIVADKLNAIGVLKTRSLPGDDLLIASSRQLIAAALALGGPCPKPRPGGRS